MECPKCKIAMLLMRRDDDGKAIFACRNPRCEDFKKEFKEKKSID